MKKGFIFLTTLTLVLLVPALAGGHGLAQSFGSGGKRLQVDSLSSPALTLPSTGFTYQGQLKQGGNLVSGTCDFQFGLYDAATSGNQLGNTQTILGVNVSNGLFTVQLNGSGEFGDNAFDGNARWLAISVRCPGGIGGYTNLGRQALTATPNALYSLSTGALRG
ncbi:MAG: hypothetical protein RMJ60_05420, partial [Anaerolineales bacterium]|nr:hypothetical protein [Anaerolineales bacterium]